MTVSYHIYEYSHGILWYFYLNKKYLLKTRADQLQIMRDVQLYIDVYPYLLAKGFKTLYSLNSVFKKPLTLYKDDVYHANF